MSVSAAVMTERSWCVVIPQHPRGARMARHRLAAELAHRVRPSLMVDVLAVAAELIGNAVLHAAPLPGGVVRVAWRLRPARREPGVFVWDEVEVRVTDGGAPGVPHVRDVALDSPDGRGLSIVSALADHWGVERDGLGQSVWARLSCPPALREAALAVG